MNDTTPFEYAFPTRPSAPVPEPLREEDVCETCGHERRSIIHSPKWTDTGGAGHPFQARVDGPRESSTHPRSQEDGGATAVCAECGLPVTFDLAMTGGGDWRHVDWPQDHYPVPPIPPLPADRFTSPVEGSQERARGERDYLWDEIVRMERERNAAKARVAELERELAQARERATQAEGQREALEREVERLQEQRDYYRLLIQDIHRDTHDAMDGIREANERNEGNE